MKPRMPYSPPATAVMTLFFAMMGAMVAA